MPGRRFLLQGLTPNTHLEAVKALLSLPDLESAVVCVAFANKAGVELIAAELGRAGDRVDVFVGIRNGITTKEGLLALLNTGVNVHCVDTGARHLVFHPKFYVARSDARAIVVVGSANLTLGGLNNNIESSVVLDLDLSRDEDLEFLESIVTECTDLAGEHPRHVVRIKRRSDVEQLYSQGRVSDEASSRTPHPVGGTKEAGDALPTMTLKVTRLVSATRRVAPSGQGPSLKTPTSGGASLSRAPTLEVVWRSKALTERDLGVPSGKNTHPTGSINLDKGLLDDATDHRHYFRDEVFPHLDWKTRSATVDEAHTTFGLIVKGVARGDFRLRIAHTTSTRSRSYQQRNAMTRLSWGQMRRFVAHTALIGSTLTLYRDTTDPTQFVVEID